MAALLQSYVASRHCKSVQQQINETEKRHVLFPSVLYDEYAKNVTHGKGVYTFKTLVYNVAHARTTQRYNPGRPQWRVIRQYIIENEVTDGLLVEVSVNVSLIYIDRHCHSAGSIG